ncbi:DMT family transporter [Rossellomorea aquimaris]|uniref:DMT family transporter n=1 Tax=Rossellomorea aquimaris TaxID=189382 RepID=UPI0005CB4F5B|nr:DMT family transporter [Rossellomorea aquimaris]
MNKYVYGMLVIITTSLMGSGFAIGKIGITYISPLLLNSLRFILAGIIMTIIVGLLRKPTPRKLKDWLLIAVIGFFQSAGVMGCIFISLRTISASESSILTFTNPLIVIVLSTIFLRVRYKLSQWIGVLVGFIGVFITLGGHLDFKIGTGLSLLAAVSWATATTLIKVVGERFNTWALTAYQMLFGGIFLFFLSIVFEKPSMLINWTSTGIVLWLSIMASIVQFSIWFYLLKIGDPGKTSAFLFLAPFFGVLFGHLLLDEVIKINVVLGGLFIFIGIFLVNWKSTPKIQEY